MSNKKVKSEDLTEAQKEEIKARQTEALEMLKKLQLSPAAFVYADNIGDDRFAFKVQPYLRDIKYLD